MSKDNADILKDNADIMHEVGRDICVKMLEVFRDSTRNAPDLNTMDFVDFHMKVISCLTLTLISGLEFHLKQNDRELDVIYALDALNSHLKEQRGVALKVTEEFADKLLFIDLHATNTIN